MKLLFCFQSIPQFLPVMRGTLSLPANRDPEVLERLQPVHLANVCNRMQSHLNACSSKVAADQAQITAKIKEVIHCISLIGCSNLNLVVRVRE